VHLFNRSDVFRADEVTVTKVLAHPKMKAYKNTDIVSVEGEKFVSGVTYKNSKTGETGTLPVTGIFIEIGSVPATDFAKNVVKRTDINTVVTDPRTQRTSQLGIWAAGDCTDGLYHQNNIAAGDAVKALEDIYLYLHAQ
jgi:thioredoxin reductase